MKTLLITPPRINLLLIGIMRATLPYSLIYLNEECFLV